MKPGTLVVLAKLATSFYERGTSGSRDKEVPWSR
jgi:hypothetical protein